MQANDEIARGQLVIYTFGSFPGSAFDPETGLPTMSRGGGAINPEQLSMIQAHNQRVWQVWQRRELERTSQ